MEGCRSVFIEALSKHTSIVIPIADPGATEVLGGQLPVRPGTRTAGIQNSDDPTMNYMNFRLAGFGRRFTWTRRQDAVDY